MQSPQKHVFSDINEDKGNMFFSLSIAKKKGPYYVLAAIVITVLLMINCLAFAKADNRCGDDLIWNLNEEGILSITGSGTMTDFSGFDHSAPWQSLSNTIVSVYIGEGVTSIGDNAFYGCTEIGDIILPDSLTTIGTKAFESCIGLHTINLPKNLISIGNEAFRYCSGLKVVFIPTSLTTIGEGAFNGCFALTDFLVSNDNPIFRSIDGVLFNTEGTILICYPQGRNGGYIIPDGVTTVSSYAFYSCMELNSIVFPDSIVSIEKMAFQSCSGLSTVTLRNGLKKIGEKAFCYCTGLREITFPDSVDIISDEAFRGCSSLNNVITPRNTVSIGSSAFSSCTSLTNFVMQIGVISIGDYAFYNCGKLKNLTIPASIKSIGNYAFYYCTSMEKITIRNGKVNFGMSAFYGCPSYMVLQGFSGSSTQIYARDNNLKFQAIDYDMEEPDFRFPEDLTIIDSESFSGTNAMVIDIPDNIVAIGNKAFANCTALMQIRIPASVTIIPEDIFDGIPFSQITIFGAANSAAETFANAKGILFIAKE